MTHSIQEERFRCPSFGPLLQFDLVTARPVPDYFSNVCKTGINICIALLVILIGHTISDDDMILAVEVMQTDYKSLCEKLRSKLGAQLPLRPVYHMFLPIIFSSNTITSLILSPHPHLVISYSALNSSSHHTLIAEVLKNDTIHSTDLLQESVSYAKNANL